MNREKGREYPRYKFAKMHEHHTNSFVVNARLWYSTSVEEVKIVGYFFVFKGIKDDLRKKQKPKMERLSTLEAAQTSFH